MSTATIKTTSTRRRKPDLNRQVAQPKAVFRELRDTLEDLDNRRELAHAKQRNAGQRGGDWETVKKELGCTF